MAKKKNVNERISEALNIEHEIIDAEVIEEPKTEIMPAPQKSMKDFHLERDYDYVRGNLKDIVEKGTVASQVHQGD